MSVTSICINKQVISKTFLTGKMQIKRTTSVIFVKKDGNILLNTVDLKPFWWIQLETCLINHRFYWFDYCRVCWGRNAQVTFVSKPQLKLSSFNIKYCYLIHMLIQTKLLRVPLWIGHWHRGSLEITLTVPLKETGNSTISVKIEFFNLQNSLTP